MQVYLKALQHILDHGELRADRTGTGVISTFDCHMEFDMRYTFPLLTTKKVFFRGVVEELLWFLQGHRNVRPLQEKGVHIWDAWADETGDLGPIYGYQWRNWIKPDGTPIDQIYQFLRRLREDPFSRRHIVSAWNVADIEDMALPPCHLLFQAYVDTQARVSLSMYQRSADMFLGVPFNIASYGLLLHLICASLRCTPDKTSNRVGVDFRKATPHRLVITLGDAHIYTNHIEQVHTQLTRTPLRHPTLTVTPRVYLDAYTAEDIVLQGYNHHPKLEGKISV